MPYPRIYVCSLQTPGYYYVGCTLREAHHREREHAEGRGSLWTTKHGFKRMVFSQLVRTGTGCRLEDDLTLALMYRYGWGAVRGGNFVARNNALMYRWLPPLLQALAPTDVLPLHLRPVSKLPAELRALVDRFEVLCGFEHPNELHANALAEARLRCVTN